MATLFLFIITGLVIWWLASYAYAPGPVSDSKSVIVYIEKGSSVKEIGEILDAAGLICDDIRFPIIAKLSGKSGHLQAGEFRLETGKSVIDTIRMLAYAKPVQYKVTLREGLTGAEMAEIFEQRGFCDRRSYLNLLRDQAFIEKLGLGSLTSLEGYLFPDTYYLTHENRGAAQLIDVQVKRFLAVWNELVADRNEVVDRQKVVTLASIVEKETGTAEERPLIAGVFYNRLNKKMRLQSDPTVVYGIDNFDGIITKSLLKNPTPYNTYVLPGLPAGPISNPGREALMAALNPAKTEFLYFVSQNDGSHYFSKTLSEHNRAVQKYQRKKN